jgi:hypothetical protein
MSAADRETTAALLNLVSYTVRENSLPTELCLGPELADLASKELPNVNFTLAQAVPCECFSTSASQCYDIILISTYFLQVATRYSSKAKEREAQERPIPAASTMASSSAAFSVESVICRADEERERKRQILASMKDATDQDEDQCMFYLEASQWDMDEAMKLMRHRSTKANRKVEELLVPGASIIAPSSAAQIRADEEPDEGRKRQILAAMKDNTSLDEGQCIFYLEASHWDINKAIELFSSFV